MCASYKFCLVSILSLPPPFVSQIEFFMDLQEKGKITNPKLMQYQWAA